MVVVTQLNSGSSPSGDKTETCRGMRLLLAGARLGYVLPNLSCGDQSTGDSRSELSRPCVDQSFAYRFT